MKLHDCASALKEAGDGASIALILPGGRKSVLSLENGALVVQQNGKEAFRVDFTDGKGTVYRGSMTSTRDPTADCLQKCYDKCGGSALCVDKCSMNCF